MNLQVILEQRTEVEAFQRKHRIGLLASLFTDLVGSTKLKPNVECALLSLLRRLR